MSVYDFLCFATYGRSNPINLLFSVKKLGIKHINIMEWFEMRMEKILLLKSAQNPDIYHRNEKLLIKVFLKKILNSSHVKRPTDNQLFV